MLRKGLQPAVFNCFVLIFAKIFLVPIDGANDAF
jgi:hypothetical protein